MPRRLFSLLFLLGLLPVTGLAQTTVEVTISGIDEPILSNVKLLLGIQQQKNHEDLTAGRIQRLHQKAPAEISKALEPFGYYRPKIEGELTGKDQLWHASYTIDPGPALPVASANIRVSGPGTEETAFVEALGSTPLVNGQPFHHDDYEHLKSTLQRIADDLGYLDADFTAHEVRIDLAAYGAHIDLNLATGVRYQFGETTISGDIALDIAMIRKFVDYKAGEPFDSAKLFDLQNALSKSDYFSSVDIKIERQRINGRQIPISVVLAMRNRSRYAMGFGFGTDTGARITLGMERRYLNTLGHKFATDIKISQTHKTVSGKYTIPLTNPATDRVVLRADYSVEHLHNIKRVTQLWEAADEHIKNSWLRRYTLTYQHEDFEIGLDDGVSQLFIPSVAWNYLADSNSVYAGRGMRFNVDVRGARRDQISDTSFVQARTTARYIFQAPGGRLITRADVGNTWTQYFSDLPPTIRFFAGGDYSVRGYAYKSIGPTDASGEVIGGKSLLVTSVEYEYLFAQNWSAAVFFDAGNAFHEKAEPLHASRGVGIRRKLPIGWLRIDVAEALEQGEDPWRLHITLGPDL